MERETLMQRIMKPWGAAADWEADCIFLQYYLCQPFSESESLLENTNKVIMPSSALDRLTSLNTPFPLMFSVQNPRDDSFYGIAGGGRTCHCGVLNFTADEGFVHMPRWMMDKLELGPGDLVFFKTAFIPKGTYMKLQPHTTEFINLSDPKAVLERTLREYSCLAAGDTITIVHGGKRFSINIVETRPEGSAIDIVDTDCEVDFVAPLDYKEPEKLAASKVEKTRVEDGEKKKEKDGIGGEFIRPFEGVWRRLDGKPSVGAAASSNWDQELKEGAGSGRSCMEIRSCQKGESNEFQPFTGKKHTLM